MIKAIDVNKIFAYDADTGVVSVINGRAKEKPFTEGYKRIFFNGKHYLCHRVAMVITNGYWPPEIVDHINGDTGDNRLCNLRLANKEINRQNIKNPSSSSGVLGVVWNKRANKWQAQIKKGNKNIYLGVYSSITDAENAYINAKRLIHEGCTA